MAEVVGILCARTLIQFARVTVWRPMELWVKGIKNVQVYDDIPNLLHLKLNT